MLAGHVARIAEYAGRNDIAALQTSLGISGHPVAPPTARASEHGVLPMGSAGTIISDCDYGYLVELPEPRHCRVSD